MKEVKDNNFGSRLPNEIEYLPDQIEINSNIRRIEHPTEEDPEEFYYIADSKYYSDREYIEMQDRIIANQKSINEEQDELIAELLEGN